MKKCLWIVAIFCISNAFADTALSSISNKPLNDKYMNNIFGLSIQFPKGFTVSQQFASSYHLGDAWSAGANPVSNPAIEGKHKLAEITLFNQRKDPAGGAYYQVTVRIGASSNPKDLKLCYSKNQYNVGLTHDMDLTPFKLGPHKINGRKFIALPLTEGGGMMQYFDGISFRTKANGYCYAIEYIETGGYADYDYFKKHYAPYNMPLKKLAQKIIDSVKITQIK